LDEAELPNGAPNGKWARGAGPLIAHRVIHGGTLGKELDMLWTIAVLLGVMWLLGLLTSYTMSGFIHVLLVVALIVVIVQVIQGRRLIT
jgi:hypothetical protein